MAELGPTEQLSAWIANVTLKDIPEEIRTRAKFIILDGLACGLMAAHLPSSEKAVNALLDLEAPKGGDASIFGWGGRTATPLTAALLNSSFIQGFELDDWHSEAPVHANAIILPALIAAAQHLKIKNSEYKLSGADLLLAAIVGYEVGPRVGLGLYGAHMLTSGWHSGAVFGPSQSAASVGKILGLSAGQIEDALGIACTQACGLMSAQFESEVKRMQHGFAARSGLMAAFLAQSGYIGIKKVYEREYGGFLKQFSGGNGKTPQYRTDEIAKGLGSVWQTDHVRIKPYASMAGTHPTVDCVRLLQEKHPEQMKKLGDVKKIKIIMNDAAFHHGGWKATKPLTNTGAQMSNAFVAATQMIHGQVLAAQFGPSMLQNEDVWKLVDVTDCEEREANTGPARRQEVIIDFQDGTTLSQEVMAARGVDPPLSNEEIIEKWRVLVKDIMDGQVMQAMEEFILSLDTQNDISLLCEWLSTTTKNPLA